jgi:type II secretory pathway pseudopilin PulG
MKPSRARAIRLPGQQPGFSLAELAIVLLIVGFLLGGMLTVFSAQTEQRKWNDTRSRLEAARDAIFGYAIANGRLPCPANSASAGAEVRQTSGTYINDCGAPGHNPATNPHDYYGGVVAGVTYGLLPAVTLGYQPVDAQGFALDAWGNRIRYALSSTFSAASPDTTNYSNASTLKTSGVSFLPDDLVVCASATGISPGPGTPRCNAAPSVTNQNTVVAILYSPGKNGPGQVTRGADEAANGNPIGANDAVFVSHTPTPAGAANGEFDDQLLWIPIGTLYLKLISAGVLP